MNSYGSSVSERLQTIIRVGVCIATVLWFSGCRNAGLRLDVGQFEQWFVGAAGGVPKEFKGATPAEIDSLRRGIQMSSMTGRGTVLLADTAGRTYTVGFQTPGEFRHDTLYPLIIYLHGGTGSPLTTKGERAYEMYIFLADTLQLFLASPSANREVQWWSPAGLSRILQTVRYMTLHYPVDPDRIYCTGVSDGATGCYAVSNFIAAPFAGFIATSGYGGMLGRLGIELYPGNLMQHPLYNINAGNDRLYPLSAVNQFLDNLEQAGVGIVRKVYESQEHGFEYRTQETATICRMLSEWRRPSTGGINWIFDRSFPYAVSHVLEIDPKTGEPHYSLVAGCRNDTITIKTTGISSVILYLEHDDACKAEWCMKYGGDEKCHSPIKAPWEYDFRVMKTRCIPVLKEMTYFSLNL